MFARLDNNTFWLHSFGFVMGLVLLMQFKHFLISDINRTGPSVKNYCLLVEQISSTREIHKFLGF